MAADTAAAGRTRRAMAAGGLALAALAAVLVPAVPGAGAQALPVDPVAVVAAVETAPAPAPGDAVDDPAIWRDPTDPSRSLLVGNDKLGGLDVYDLDGTRRQRVTTATPFWGNVDIRQGVAFGAATLDVVAAYNEGLRFLTVDPVARELVPATDGTGVVPALGEGLCLHHEPAGGLSAFVITRGGVLRQFAVTDTDGDGLLEAGLTREVAVGSEAEGCVADDDTGALYIAEEDVGLWRYSTDPATGGTRTLVDAVAPAGRIAADAEGVTIVETAPGEGHVVVSAQNVAAPLDSYFVAYSRTTGAHTGSFRVVSGPDVDGCSRTDGIDATAEDLGPAFPAGVFVCQDDANTAPGNSGNQNFKLVRLEKVLEALEPAPPPPAGEVTFVAAASSNGNRLVHRTAVPAEVQPGDLLLAFFGANGASAITGPPGWDLVSEVTNGVAGRVWSRTAGDGDAGAGVTVTTAGYQRSDLSIVAYRGVDPDGPLTVEGLVQIAAGGAHAAPVVTAPAPGLVVSYWAERSSDGTSLMLPAGQVARTSSSGTGGGRITAALADAGATAGPGSVGGVTATGTSSLVRTVTFTAVLPAATAEPPPPPPPPPPADIDFVAAASTNGNRSEHATTVPAQVQAGDRLLAFFAANGSSAVTGPAGWTLVGSVGDSSALGRVWTRVATAADAGSTVTVLTAKQHKSDLSVIAHRGGTDPLVAGALDAGGDGSHTTPVIDAAGLAVSYWAEKSSSGTSLSVSPLQIPRTSSSGSGGGRITAAVADAGEVGAAPSGGVTAVGTTPTNRTVLFTVVLPVAGA